MNSNRLHNIFNSKRKLSRGNVEAYGRGDDASLKNAIEQNSMSSDFDNDAMEGWDELSFNTSALKNLDNKFLAPSYTIWYWAGGIATIGIISLLILNPFSNKEVENQLAANDETSPIVTTLTEDQEITFDESDLILSAPIEEMKTVSIEKQMQPEEIIADFAEMISINEEKKIDALPLKKPEEQEKHIVSSRKFAKEIYLNELKLVDYRKYRTNPTIQIKQVILSGTPANKENENSDNVEANWKTVDIPYLDYIDKSVYIFGKGNYKRALSRFETILLAYPDDVNANFYSGLCLYNFGEYQSAIEAFTICLDGSFLNFDEESRWMMALCYEQLGQKNDAKRLFTEIKKSNGYYSNQAKDKLGE